jgi:hypothetical protein
MSDVGSLKRPGGSPFPSVRKSSDPFVPEMGQIDFTHEVQEFDSQFSTSVHESEKTEQNIISEENRRRQFRQRQRKRKAEEEKETKPGEDDESLIDLTA